MSMEYHMENTWEIQQYLPYFGNREEFGTIAHRMTVTENTTGIPGP